MNKEYNVYIDEAGDEGIKKGSKYFIITAVVVKKEKDLEISRYVDMIKKFLEIDIKKQLHWKLLKGFNNKIMIMNITGDLDIKIVNVIVDTKSINVIKPHDIYYYFSGYLYERLCWLMKEEEGVCNINISSRGNLSLNKLENYIRCNNNVRFEIDKKRIKSIKIIPNQKKKLLQLSDCCCSALFQALKYNNDMHFEYIDSIKENIYSRNNNLISYGLKIVPNIKNSIELNNLLNYLTQ